MNELIKTPEILQVDSIDGISIEKRKEIIDSYLPFTEKLQEFAEKAKSIEVTDITQIELMAQAREIRLAAVKNRTAMDTERKRLKEEGKLFNDAVQDAYNKFKKASETMEEHLENQEMFAEIAAEARRQKVIVERMDLIKDFPNVTSEMIINLDDAMFNVFLQGLKEQKAKEVEAIRLQQEETDRNERIAQLNHTRKSELMEKGYWEHLSEETRNTPLGEFSNEDYEYFLVAAKAVKELADKEQAEKEKELQRLKDDAAKQRSETEMFNVLRVQRVEELLKYEYTYSHAKDPATLSDQEYATILSEAVEYHTHITEMRRKEAEIAENDRKERERIKEENRILKEKEDARIKVEQEKAANEKAENDAKIAEMKRLATAGDKEKLTHWLSQIQRPTEPTIGQENAIITLKEIMTKFDGFKSWAETHINKL